MKTDDDITEVIAGFAAQDAELDRRTAEIRDAHEALSVAMLDQLASHAVGDVIDDGADRPFKITGREARVITYPWEGAKPFVKVHYHGLLLKKDGNTGTRTACAYEDFGFVR